MLKIDRQTAIGQELEKNGSVLIPNLSEQLLCSEETIRRDLKELEAAGKLARTHGGAYQVEKYDKSYPTKLREIYLKEEKARMAKRALKYVAENDVLMLDSSTTCYTFAVALLEAKINVTIITNSLLICDLCSEQSSNINLVCPGGTLRRRTTSFTGYHTTDILNCYYADKAFISCPKITLRQGLSDNHINEARVRESMIKHSKQRIMLLDHTKFDSSANILFCELGEIDVIITDAKLPSEWETYISSSSRLKIDYCLE